MLEPVDESKNLLRAAQGEDGHKRRATLANDACERFSEPFLLRFARRQLGLGVCAERGFKKKDIDGGLGVVAAGLDSLGTDAGI